MDRLCKLLAGHAVVRKEGLPRRGNDKHNRRARGGVLRRAGTPYSHGHGGLKRNTKNHRKFSPGETADYWATDTVTEVKLLSIA